MTLGPVAQEDHRLAVADLDEIARLLSFASRSAHPDGGFGALDAHGAIDRTAPLSCMVNSRMTFTFSVAMLLGFDAYSPLASVGIATLANRFEDPVFGGFYHAIPPSGDSARARPSEPDTRKRAYQTAFVALAAAAASRVSIPGARPLLDRALDELDQHFWRAENGCFVDVWDQSHTTVEPYLGANANMHGVEALMAAAGVTGEHGLLDRAVTIAATFIGGHARSHDWLLPEHFDLEGWPMLDYNADRPGDEFRPFGVTIGHLLEWSRLLVELDDAVEGSEPWLLPAARALYRTAVELGWAADGADGFVYTVDFHRQPVVRHRPHWTLAEALSAAATHWQRTGDVRYRNDFDKWRRYADRHFVEPETGTWYHELDPANRPAAHYWPGRPDSYHILQALLIPALPLAPSLTQRIDRFKEEPWSSHSA